MQAPWEVARSAQASLGQVIGETLGRYVAMRRFIGINTTLMRVCRIILTQRGFSLAKVAILVGGPDWPVSVIIGIMRLPLLPVIVGTLPVIVLVAPLSLSGSFMVESEAPYPSLGKVAAAFALLSQLGAGIVMLFCIERSAFEHKATLESMPFDDEVAALDQASQEHERLHQEITRWQSHEIPFGYRLVLSLGAICTGFAFLLSTVQGSRCFGTFTLEEPYSEQVRTKLNGSPYNMIKKPLGYTVLVLSFLGFLCLLAFLRWVSASLSAGPSPAMALLNYSSPKPLRPLASPVGACRGAPSNVDTMAEAAVRCCRAGEGLCTLSGEEGAESAAHHHCSSDCDHRCCAKDSARLGGQASVKHRSVHKVSR